MPLSFPVPQQPGQDPKVCFALCEGDEVEEKQPIAVIEAMKMETNILATQKGVVDKIYISEGQQVKAGEMVISVLQDSYGQGTQGVETALKIVKGEEFEQDLRIPFLPITAENVDAYLEGGPAAIQ